ncbi:MAG: hypothetical protein M0T85_15740 [Dehalococcoidales bacterium]|nr:hypothetical protein [Dehalococcoidales bacterium]
MKINRNYKPWLMVPSDDSRPVLEHALVERTGETSGVLVVTDGFVMGVFDVELEPGETVGLVKAKYLKYARSTIARKRSEFTYEVKIDDGWVVMPDGSRHPQIQRLSYPAWRRIVPPLKGIAKAKPRVTIAIAPGLLHKTFQAMDFQATVRIRFTGGNGGVFFITSNAFCESAEEWASVQPPFRATDARRLVYRAKRG